MAEYGESRLENVVEYEIFDTRNMDLCSSKSALDDVQEILYEILSYVNSLVVDYIWQNDSFNLRVSEQLVKSHEVNGSIPCLNGSTHFGDNIEDEWFIAYILFNISKKFPYLVARINDNDGEFLLIEAANYLPKWLEPETSENRVFIYQGKLHIIPLPSNPSEITIFPAAPPTITQALKILVSNSGKTVALPWIQEPVKVKIEEYPNKILSSFHHVLCYLPKPIKYLLERKPSLIAAVVLAFVNRDPCDTKSCLKLSRFPFECLEPHRVQFTKCLYGQLAKHNFIPDTITQKILKETSSTAYKGHLLGLQITYGFEILHAQKQTSNVIPVTSAGKNQQWEKYLNALQHHGYFMNEVIGSKLYCQLMQQAKEYFSRSFLCTEHHCDNHNYIEELLEEMPSDSVANTVVSRFIDDDDNDDDDDESWLEISPEDLESILSKYGCEKQLDYNETDLNTIVHGMNSFVDTISGYDGADLPSEHNETEVQFDPEGFMEKMASLFSKPGRHPNNQDSSEDESSDSNDAELDEEYIEYTSRMDKELLNTDIAKSFVKFESSNKKVDKDVNEFEQTLTDKTVDESELKPVDIDLNLVQNFLESYTLQEGMPGPVSNILNSMGIPLPSNLTENT